VGLWDWIFEALTGQTASDDRAQARAVPEPPRSHATATAVATPDEPDTPAPDEEEQPAEGWWRVEGEGLTELARIERPEDAQGAQRLENLLVQQFDGHDLTMPPLPQVPERVLQRLRDRNCSFARVAEDIAEDQVVAASVLRAVNSPLYRGVNEITSLQTAVARLGVNALRTLMMHQALKAATFLKKSGDKELAESVWRRSLACAHIMNGLARFTRVDAEDAWLIGLMHDVGNVIVLRVIQGHQALTGHWIAPDMFEYLCHESHQEFGELVAASWNLPPRIKELVSNHHTYPEPDDPLRTERLMLHLTDMIAARLGYAPPAPYDLLASRPVQDLGLAWRNTFIPFLEDLPIQIKEAMIYF